jgi:hypothetical protein
VRLAVSRGWVLPAVVVARHYVHRTTVVNEDGRRKAIAHYVNAARKDWTLRYGGRRPVPRARVHLERSPLGAGNVVEVWVLLPGETS